MEKILANAFGAVVLSGARLLCSFLWARVFQDLWRWFIAPVFHLSPLHFWQAMGLLLSVHLLTAGITKVQVDGEMPWWGKSLTSITAQTIAALLFWAFGAVYASFL